MSRDIKDIMNTVEEKTRSQAELEQIISTLKEEINRLKNTEKEQHLLIQNLKSQMNDEQIEKIQIPSEIDVLKDIVSSQRQDLNEKENIIEKLNNKIDNLTVSIDNQEEVNGNEMNNKELLDAQMQIVQLNDENQEYKNRIISLQNKIDELRTSNGEIKESEEENEEPEIKEELFNVKKLNFQLMEENGLLRVELETLKAKFQERLDEASSLELESEKEKNLELSTKIDSLKNKLIEVNEKSTEELEAANELNENLSSEIESLKSTLTEIIETNSEELKEANNKIAILNAELEDLEAKVKYFETQLRDNNQSLMISTEESLEFADLREKYDNMKREISKYQEENQKLNDIIKQLNEKEVMIHTDQYQEAQIFPSIPKRIDLSLFSRMYFLLDENNKRVAIDLLIHDLGSEKIETKRNAIKVLSYIQSKKVYDALFELINDKDWIVRYDIIKALSKFEKKSEKFTSLLKKLTKDDDVDVRELAFKVLNEIS